MILASRELMQVSHCALFWFYICFLCLCLQLLLIIANCSKCAATLIPKCNKKFHHNVSNHKKIYIYFCFFFLLTEEYILSASNIIHYLSSGSVLFIKMLHWNSLHLDESVVTVIAWCYRDIVHIVIIIILCHCHW